MYRIAHAMVPKPAVPKVINNWITHLLTEISQIGAEVNDRVGRKSARNYMIQLIHPRLEIQAFVYLSIIEVKSSWVFVV